MPDPITCTECRTKIRVPDEFAGKRVKCPKCQAVLLVPEAEDEGPEERIADAPVGKKRRRDEDDERPLAKTRSRRHEEDEDEDDRPSGRRKPQYKACPKCGAVGAKRVLWTAWGSFYGPALFSHVRCPDCSYCYNGRSGRSNALPATIFVLVPLLGILAILGGLGYLFYKMGYFG